MTKNKIILNVNDLKVSFTQNQQETRAVDGISFELHKGQSLGIVGESGSGKSVTSLTILNLLKSNDSNKTDGEISYFLQGNETKILTLDSKDLQEIRGRKISMVFQEPMSSLNPVRRCGSQVKELLDVHDIGIPSKRKDTILNLFKKVALPDVERIYSSYPHELSGGQLQRVIIAMALASTPDIIICDEPTTALDVTVQKQILTLLKNLTQEFNIAMIFISHDLDVVAHICDSVLVMKNGEVVEKGLLPDVFNNPQHSYTQALISCKPNTEAKGYKLPTVGEILNRTYKKRKRILFEWEKNEPLLEVEDLKVYYKKGGGLMTQSKAEVKAVDSVSFSIKKGEILGIVGESGSGKSTIANCVVGLVKPTAGTIKYEGELVNPTILSKNKLLRTKIQLVFQDPYSSLNPRLMVKKAISEPIDYHQLEERKNIDHRVIELLQQVGLDASFGERYPHQLSGGQRQRICIARALSLRPDLLVCDESVSALDVSVQAQILNLLDELREKLGLTLLFISHDLSVIHYLCDSILVMHEGKIVERGSADTIMKNPVCEYTKTLINSAL